MLREQGSPQLTQVAIPTRTPRKRDEPYVSPIPGMPNPNQIPTPIDRPLVTPLPEPVK